MKPENPDGVRGSYDTGVAAKREKGLRLDLQAHRGGAVIVHCQGRIIFGPEARALTTLVADVLPTAGRMVVDLAGVESVDSAGLGELVLLHMWAEAAGHALKFAGPRRRVRNLLELTNLASVFDTYGSVAEAAAAMCNEEVCPA